VFKLVQGIYETFSRNMRKRTHTTIISKLAIPPTDPVQTEIDFVRSGPLADVAHILRVLKDNYWIALLNSRSAEAAVLVEEVEEHIQEGHRNPGEAVESMIHTPDNLDVVAA
jgi:hypothetical protein